MEIDTLQPELHQLQELLKTEAKLLKQRQASDLSFEDLSQLDVALENNWEVLSSILKRMFTKFLNLGYRVVKLVRGLVQKIQDNGEKIMQSWESHIRPKLEQLDPDYLNEKSMELFPMDIWVNSIKVVLPLLDLIKQAEQICDDPSKNLYTNRMKQVQQQLATLGIKITMGRLSVNYDDWLDKRKYQPIASSGYDRSVFPAIFRYATSLGTHLPNRIQEQALTQRYDNYMQRLAQESGQLEEQVTLGKLKRASPQYKTANDRIMDRMTRMGYCYSVFGVAMEMARQLSSDVVKLFDVVEDQLSLKKD